MEPQQPQPQTASPVAPTVPPQTEAPKAHEPAYVGLIIAACIILLILILGGLYLWGSTAITRSPNAELATQSQTENPDAPLDAIADDLSMDLAELDQDLAELDAAFAAETTATSIAQ